MADYTHTDADWRENAKYGLVGVTADDATEHWDRWLAEHDAALLEGLADEIRHKQHAESIRQMLREKARQRRGEQS